MYVHEALDTLLKNNGYQEKDVHWIGSSDGHFAMTVTAFLEHFGDRYHDIYQDLANDLVITLFDGNWFEREEGGGEQFWVLRKQPQLMPTSVAFDTYESRDRRSMAYAVSHAQE